MKDSWVNGITLLMVGVLVGIVFTSQHYKYKVCNNHIERTKQIKEPLAQLEYGWHSCEETAIKTYFRHNGDQVRIKFDDGCMAGWHELKGYFWMNYSHPVDIINDKIVYLKEANNEKARHEKIENTVCIMQKQ